MHVDWAITARWANFLATVSFVFIGLAAIAVVGIMALFSEFDSLQLGPLSEIGEGVLGLVFLVGIAFYLIPAIFLFRFARHLKASLESNHQAYFESAWANFRNYFRWAGVLTIAIILAYSLFFAFVLGRL